RIQPSRDHRNRRNGWMLIIGRDRAHEYNVATATDKTTSPEVPVNKKKNRLWMYHSAGPALQVSTALCTETRCAPECSVTPVEGRDRLERSHALRPD
ncbi:MAG TPA: hypothetical protein VIJ31_15465, partial [Acidothermaceae bacterium]